MIKEYADINEDLELSLDGEKIKVKHHCKKAFKDQNPQAIEDLKQVITSELKLNKKDGFIPYDNFECSIHWNVEKKNPKQLEFKFNNIPIVKTEKRVNEIMEDMSGIEDPQSL